MKIIEGQEVWYLPTAGPWKGRLCPAIVTEIVGPDLVNLEVRDQAGNFVEQVANVQLVKRKPKEGQGTT